ncbi:hypothetical protein glysoja_033708 [Glycine soja]|nr:hypothetical protein glysoja_033708 [Glycine soja]
MHKSLHLGRPSYLTKTLKPLLGNGIIRSNGLQWAFPRNLLAPEFFHSKIKLVEQLEASKEAKARGGNSTKIRHSL